MWGLFEDIGYKSDFVWEKFSFAEYFELPQICEKNHGFLREVTQIDVRIRLKHSIWFKFFEWDGLIGDEQERARNQPS